MTTTQVARRSAAARLDRLPITSYHRQIMWILGFVFFSELGGINTFSFAAPAILKQWGLSIATIGYLTSATFLGMFVGAATGGWFSDRMGRKRALVLTTVWFSGFSLLNSAVWNAAGLFAARLLTGVGLSAMTVVGITYVSELFPAAKRGAYQGWIMTIGLVGIPATAYVARFSIPLAPWGWRLVFVWGGLGLIFAGLAAAKFEESPRWYENRGMAAEADAVLNRLETRAQAEFGDLPPVNESVPASIRGGGYSELFAGAYLRRTIILLVTWIAQTLGFYGFMAWVPTLLVAHGFSMVNSLAWSSAISIGAVPGALIAALIAERWERKRTITVVAVVIAFCGLMYGLTFKTALIVVFGFSVAMFLQTFAPLLYAYTAECYPTEIRNSGTGLTYGVGRLANAFGPLLVAFLYKQYGYTSVFVYIAAMWLVVALTVSAFGPLTKGRSLTRELDGQRCGLSDGRRAVGIKGKQIPDRRSPSAATGFGMTPRANAWRGASLCVTVSLSSRSQPRCLRMGLRDLLLVVLRRLPLRLKSCSRRLDSRRPPRSHRDGEATLRSIA